ncbi:hypothetical protein B0O99DRAFT_647724 [Bisporella sp. PMI_857]|nr:hypothetical protein B0O99DRAFT_647724 [Bisporella sp. PMI_857]
MGLAAPKNRIKISHDPNNTRWTGNKESFGHKIMAAQGWSEGQYLGAVNAPHAVHYTAANASHIRVAIKDDNLGLGAKIGSGVGAGECTGLDAFKDLLGRLNGKEEEEIQQEQRKREDLKRAIYSERKWGSVRFVKGGWLVGDKIQDLIDGEKERLRELEEKGSSSSDDSNSEASDSEPPAAEKLKKKRKVEIEDDAEERKKSKKSKKRKLDDEDRPAEVVAFKVKKSKKEKDRRRKSKTAGEPAEADIVDNKALEKAEKKRRKEEKKANKARREKESSDDSDKASKQKLKEKRKRTLNDITESSAPETPSAISTPLNTSGRSTPIMTGRHAVRSRNIAQKRLASMDVASLNQIFMIKTPS